MPNTSRMPASLKWGLDNENNTHEKYLECLGKKNKMWKLRTLDWLLAQNDHFLVVFQMVLFWKMESQLAVLKLNGHIPKRI